MTYADHNNIVIHTHFGKDQTTMLLEGAILRSTLPASGAALPFDCKDLVKETKTRRTQLIGDLTALLSKDAVCDDVRADMATVISAIAALPELIDMPARLTHDEQAFVLMGAERHGWFAQSRNQKCLKSAIDLSVAGPRARKGH